MPGLRQKNRASGRRAGIAKKPGCGNPRCRVSTGIHDALTFGSGKLDDFGFWQHGCRECASAFEAADRAMFGSYWPHPHPDLVDMVFAAETEGIGG